MTQAHSAGCRYTIHVDGHISAGWVDWPYEVETCHDTIGAARQAVTVLTVSLPDQPALYGMLQAIRDLNLKLISIQSVEETA